MDSEIYYLYHKIRYIVEDDHCHKITAQQVKNKINEADYNVIMKLYGMKRETVDEVINIVIKSTPPSKIP